MVLSTKYHIDGATFYTKTIVKNGKINIGSCTIDTIYRIFDYYYVRCTKLYASNICAMDINVHSVYHYCNHLQIEVKNTIKT